MVFPTSAFILNLFEYFFLTAVIGRRNYPSSHQQLNQAANYKRFHDYASFSSFSDTSSHIVRRPSCDTISTYLSSQYRYGGSSSRTASSYYGGSFGGSQDLIDMYGHETDSVFTDDDDHISFRSSTSRRSRSRYEEPAWNYGLNKRVLSDPALHANDDDDLYVNLKDQLSLHSRQTSLATSHHSLMRSQQSLAKSHNHSFMKSQNSLRSPQRGATIHDSQIIPTNLPISPITTPTKNGTLKKRPVPTPRTIMNTTVPSSDVITSTKSYYKIDKLIR